MSTCSIVVEKMFASIEFPLNYSLKSLEKGKPEVRTKIEINAFFMILTANLVLKT